MERIKRVFKGTFRTTLEPQNINVGLYDEWLITETNEKILVLSPALAYPDLGLFYRKRLTSLYDENLPKLANRLKYLNQGISQQGLKKLTEYVIRNFTKITRTEGGSLKAAISHEEMFDYLSVKFSDRAVDMSDIYLSKSVLFQNDSKISKETKISITKKVNGNAISKVYGDLIHLVANALIEESEPELIITRPKVLDEINETKRAMSKNTLSRHIREDTKNLLKAAKEQGLSTRVEVIEKYKAFLSLDEGVTFDQAVKTLNVSKSTVKKFKDYKDGEV